MEHMLFGTATASYQIEGAHDEDGRTPCVWDTFAAQPGNVRNMDNGNTACDHYHRYKEDIALMAELGTDSYRFSIAWPRIFPQKGQYNPAGMAFYKNLLAELAKHNLRPAITLYHWDLPQWAQDLGGWATRECTDWFIEYAQRCFAELDSEGTIWITHNEPWCDSLLANFEGVHAPGNTDLELALRCAHHLLVSHGQAVRLYREIGGKGTIGITLNLTPALAMGNSFTDKLAARMHDGYQNHWFLQPLFKKSYPLEMLSLYSARCATDWGFIHEEDFETIGQDCDFLGLNFYTHTPLRYSPGSYLLYKGATTGLPQTDIGWDISPDALGTVLHMIRSYTDLPVYITENGSCWDDELADDGAVHDAGRVDYLLRHLEKVEELNAEGMNIAGYYAWSFMDNFEWSFGYSKRFGIVHVDYNTLNRTPKDSYYAYQKYLAERKK